MDQNGGKSVKKAGRGVPQYQVPSSSKGQGGQAIWDKIGTFAVFIWLPSPAHVLSPGDICVSLSNHQPSTILQVHRCKMFLILRYYFFTVSALLTPQNARDVLKDCEVNSLG